MLFHDALEFPHEVIATCNNPLDTKELDTLAALSMDTVIATDSRQVVGVFGCVPLGMLSQQALVWIMFPKGLEVTPSRLREARKDFQEWATERPWDLFAEVWLDNAKGHRLARFMGFEKFADTDDRSRYQYKGH